MKSFFRINNIYTIGFFIILVIFVVAIQTHYPFIDGFENNHNTPAPDNHTKVDVPLTTTSQCLNMCGPVGRCSKTGEDCSNDTDCTGCKQLDNAPEVIPKPEDDAGKLSFGSTHVYSDLTVDFGSKATLISDDDKFTDMPQPYKGENTWREIFDVGMKLYEKRYAPDMTKGMNAQAPKYPEHNTMLGEFNDIGPLAANTYL